MQCDGLAAQMVDAQHKLDAVRTLQGSLVPLVAGVKQAEGGDYRGGEAPRRRAVHARRPSLEQEKRYAELVAASKAVATDVAERTRQMQALGEELARSTKSQGRDCSPNSIASRGVSATRSARSRRQKIS